MAASPKVLEHKTQETSNNQQDASPKVIKEGGWLIPGLSESKVKEARRRYQGYEGMEVYFTVLKPQRDIVTQFTPEELEHKARVLTFHNRHWLVDDITQYDINHQVFCYMVSVSMVDLSGPDKTLVRYMASTGIVYYDEDGDGKFETLDLGNNLRPPHIPQWLQAAYN
jgi:hypothetical protein